MQWKKIIPIVVKSNHWIDKKTIILNNQIAHTTIVIVKSNFANLSQTSPVPKKQNSINTIKYNHINNI